MDFPKHAFAVAVALLIWAIPSWAQSASGKPNHSRVSARRTRTSLVIVKAGSDDAEAILLAQIAYIKAGPAASRTNVDLSPIVIKKNDKYAYLVARLSSPGSQPNFLDAILEREDGKWTSFGYQLGMPKHGGSIADMCGYGDGIGADVFKECGAKR